MNNMVIYNNGINDSPNLDLAIVYLLNSFCVAETLPEHSDASLSFLLEEQFITF